MNSKEFSTRENLVLTDDMKTLVSATAMQLMFGLDDYMLEDFHSIILYPTTFKSTASGNKHKGETNLRGVIVLSWRHFTEGLDDSSDGINLGLHEFTHALRFNGVRGGSRDNFFEAYFPKFNAVAQRTMKHLRNQLNPPIREYGLSNADEFFAAVVELFFEEPENMKQELPEVYRHLCILLNQDPAQRRYATDVREHLWPEVEMPRGSIFLVAGDFSPLQYFINVGIIAAGILLMILGSPGELRGIGFLLFCAALLMLHFRWWYNRRLSFYENGIFIEEISWYRPRYNFYPYTLVTKVEYEEYIEPVDADNEIEIVPRIMPRGNYLATITVHYAELHGSRSCNAHRAMLLDDKIKSLRDALQQHLVWVRIKLLEGRLEGTPLQVPGRRRAEEMRRRKR